MIFYDYWRSSSAWRVRIALKLKGVSVERRAVNLAAAGGGQQHAPEFQALNPLGEVPILLVDDPDGQSRALTQSVAILDYLEARFPDPPLYPADPWRRARARQLAEIVNAGTQPYQNLSFQQRLRADGVADPAAWARHYNQRGLRSLEALAGETAGDFLIGDAPSLADLYLIPQLYSARRFGVELDPFPTLRRVEISCVALPAFKAAHPDVQPDAPGPGA